MPADTPAKTPTTVPLFECKLPAGLLEGLNERDQYLYRSVDEMRQAIAWSAATSAATANRVEQVHEQASATNGSVARATREIADLRLKVEAQAAEVAPIVRAYGFGKVLAKSRLFWIGAAAFLVFGAPALVSVAPAPIAFLKAAVSVLLGV